MSEMSRERSEPTLPKVTNDTLEGVTRSVIENPTFLVDAAKSLRDQQPELIVLISAYASRALNGRLPEDVATLSVALAYELLSRQVVNDQLHNQYADIPMTKPTEINTSEPFMDTSLNNYEKEVIVRNIVVVSQIIAGGKTDDGWPRFSMEEYVGVRDATSKEAVGTEEQQMLGALVTDGYLFLGEDGNYSVTEAFLELVAAPAVPDQMVTGETDMPPAAGTQEAGVFIVAGPMSRQSRSIGFGFVELHNEDDGGPTSND